MTQGTPPGTAISHSDWAFVPEAPVDAASRFDPNLATQAPVDAASRFDPNLATQAPTALPPVPRSPAAPLARSQTQEEESAWLAAVANAKSKSSEEVARLVSPAQQVSDPKEETEEDWEALMASARARAEADAPTAAQVLATARERAKSEPPFVPQIAPVFAPPPLDAASAQVEKGALAANDDRGAVVLSALPSASASAEQEEDEEWKRMRAQVEAKDFAESERKMRAMREIQRLRGSRGNTGSIPATKPPRRRFAAGTAGPALTNKAPQRSGSLVMSPGPVARRRSAAASETARELPRITSRLGKQSGS